MGNQLTGYLESNSTAKKWFLQNQGLHARDVRVLAKYLKKNPYVEEVDLSHNNIGDDGVHYLCKILPKNAKVTTLHLHHCNITDVGCEELMRALKQSLAVREVDLANNRLTDTAAASVARLLTSTKTLEKISLKFNHIGDSGCEALAGALRENRSLTHLDLEHNQIGSVGAWALADVLLVNSCVVDLYLSYNQITDPGARALAEMLLRNSTLASLLLSGNPISYQTKQDISENMIARRTAKVELDDMALRLMEQQDASQREQRRGIDEKDARAKATISKQLGIPTMLPGELDDEVRQARRSGRSQAWLTCARVRDEYCKQGTVSPSADKTSSLFQNSSETREQLSIETGSLPVSLPTSLPPCKTPSATPLTGPGSLSDISTAALMSRSSDWARETARTAEVEALLKQYQDEVEGARKQWLTAERKELELQKEKAEVESKNGAMLFLLKEKEKHEAELLARIKVLEAQVRRPVTPARRRSAASAATSDSASSRRSAASARDRELLQLRQAYREQQSRLREVQQHCRRLENKLAEKAINESRLREQIDTLELSLEDVSSLAASLRDKASVLSQHQQSLGPGGAGAEQAGAAAEAAIESLTAQLEIATQRCDRLQQLLDTVHSHKAQLLEEANSRAASLQRQVETCTAAIERLETQLEESRNGHTQTQFELQSVMKKLEAKEAELGRLRAAIGTEDAALPDKARQRIAALKADRQALQHALNETRLAHAMLQDLFEQQQAFLQQWDPELYQRLQEELGVEADEEGAAVADVQFVEFGHGDGAPVLPAPDAAPGRTGAPPPSASPEGASGPDASPEGETIVPVGI